MTHYFDEIKTRLEEEAAKAKARNEQAMRHGGIPSWEEHTFNRAVRIVREVESLAYGDSLLSAGY